METAQQFSLGQLVTPKGISSPVEARVEIQGRGIFCRVVMELGFDSDDPTVPRLLTVERPWNAVLVGAALNGDELERSEGTAETLPLPASLRAGVEEVLSEGKTEIVTYHVEPGRSLRSVTLEFVMACDVLWHRSGLAVQAQAERTAVEMEVNWDLSGLPGASLECDEAAADSRFSVLEDSRHQWSETLTLRAGERLGIDLLLDEKKPASLCLYSPGESGPGCGAVVVVAPVRPQLLRKPVRVAVVVEVRNPQEGLLARELVDQLSTTLGPQDQIAIYLMGSSVTRNIVDWRQADEIQEDDLAQLLEPSAMGRAQYFWESFQRVLEECHGATHVLLSTTGPKDPSPDDFVCHLPVFCFATGRKPNLNGLEALANQTGGFVSEHGIDGMDSFLQRFNIRLSPPLLRDFRLEGWGLDKIYPPGVIQVYTDKPTLVLGLYEGLLPQTVTLGGLSPAGQKLAQRVRVENFTLFDLMPLFQENSRPRPAADSSVRQIWRGDGATLVEALRPVNLAELFTLEEAKGERGGLDAMGPPSIDIVSPEITFDHGDIASSLSDPGDDVTLSDDFFSGSSADGSSTFLDGDDLFGDQDPPAGGPSFLEEEPVADDVFSFDDDPAATITQAPAPVRERGTEAVTTMVPGWVRFLIELDDDGMNEWLGRCCIDDLALALADTEQHLARTFLEKLHGPRKEAVELQMELGRLLPPEERQAACENLEQALSS